MKLTPGIRTLLFNAIRILMCMQRSGRYFATEEYNYNFSKIGNLKSYLF